ncbi:MAG: CpsB/CapC family capsule biosynthesis tyrosine phosphatase, partial [Arenicellales bacterium]
LAHSLEMAQVAVDSGTTEIILTPHHNDGMYLNLKDDVIKAVNDFQLALDQNNIALKIHPGSELHVMPELPEHLESGMACTYANKNKAVLLELPKHTLPTGAENIIEQVAYMGLTPIIAHPERNSALCADPEILREWVQSGWKFQLTNQSCSGQFGEAIQDACYYWLERGWIHFIASDAHRTQGRSPDMRKGVKQIADWFGDEVAQLLSYDNPKSLIEGGVIMNMNVPDKPASKKVKKWSWFGLMR